MGEAGFELRQWNSKTWLLDHCAPITHSPDCWKQYWYPHIQQAAYGNRDSSRDLCWEKRVCGPRIKLQMLAGGWGRRGKTNIKSQISRKIEAGKISSKDQNGVYSRDVSQWWEEEPDKSLAGIEFPVSLKCPDHPAWSGHLGWGWSCRVAGRVSVREHSRSWQELFSFFEHAQFVGSVSTDIRATKPSIVKTGSNWGKP